MRVCLWGGSGCGKSTNAQILAGTLKQNGYNCELCFEWIKEWAYLKRVPKSFEQAYVFMNQLHIEDVVLNNGVDHLVTDSPVMMNTFYCQRQNFVGTEELVKIGQHFEEQYPSFNIFLSRDGIPYKDVGRYQAYAEAVEIDREMILYLEQLKIKYEVIPSLDTAGIIKVAESALGINTGGPGGNEAAGR